MLERVLVWVCYVTGVRPFWARLCSVWLALDGTHLNRIWRITVWQLLSGGWWHIKVTRTSRLIGIRVYIIAAIWNHVRRGCIFFFILLDDAVHVKRQLLKSAFQLIPKGDISDASRAPERAVSILQAWQIFGLIVVITLTHAMRSIFNDHSFFVYGGALGQEPEIVHIFALHVFRVLEFYQVVFN